MVLWALGKWFVQALGSASDARAGGNVPLFGFKLKNGGRSLPFLSLKQNGGRTMLWRQPTS